MNVLVFETEDKVNEAAANIIAARVQTNPRTVLGLATGGTPVGIYGQLASAFERGTVSFRQVTTFNLDEYVGLPSDHPESYHSYMHNHLFRHIDVPASQRHIPNGNAADPAAEGIRYEEQIEQAGGIDMQLLGLGHNGHIGFNEPAPSLAPGTRVVELAEETRQANARYFDSPEQVPSHALTMGVGMIMKARTILLVVKGGDKAAIVDRSLRGPVTTECPASLLQLHSNLVVLLDRAAAERLS